MYLRLKLTRLQLNVVNKFNKTDRSLQQMVDSEQFLATGGILLIYVCLSTMRLTADEYIMRQVYIW